MALRPLAPNRLAMLQRIKSSIAKPLQQPIGNNRPIKGAPALAKPPVLMKPTVPPKTVPAPPRQIAPQPGPVMKMPVEMPTPPSPYGGMTPGQALGGELTMPMPTPPSPYGGMTPGQALGGELTMPGGPQIGFGGGPEARPGIDPGFFSSPEYQKFDSGGPMIGTTDMYNSPYFGQMGSGSIGRAQDQAYRDYLARTGQQPQDQGQIPGPIDPQQLYNQYSAAMFGQGPTPTFGTSPETTPIGQGQTYSTGWNGTGIG